MNCLFLLACCVCSLNFTMMNFALVYALDNIGMALAVIIMVILVAGSGGSYPIDVLPEVFQKLYVLMPFHYGMDMIRETIAGRYENVYWPISWLTWSGDVADNRFLVAGIIFAAV